MSNKKKYIVGIASFLLVVMLIFVFRESMSAILDNDVKVYPQSELKYFLNVSYDGVDVHGAVSSDASVSQVRSGYLYVEDKIPDGLEFIGFVTSENGTFGAKRRNSNESCGGNVVDDTNDASLTEGTWNSTHDTFTYHGLHYSEATRTVSFNVKNLKAGCELTVGIITKTPTVDDPNTLELERRRDFYNFAMSKERDLTINSNTVHVYIGDSNTNLYNVKYEYTGTIPINAPNPPLDATYSKGAEVGVAAPVNLEGYAFSGWTSSDVTVNNGSFIMPNNEVVFIGNFTPINANKVTYQINGVIPDDYVLPKEKNYYPNSIVEVDSLKEGDVIGGYSFLGWKSEDVIISSDNSFVMPSYDVVITGSFTKVTYKVKYEFYETILPPNSDELLPKSKSYLPGTMVSLESVTEPQGYKFLGWYKENNFEMPSNDITIYGEWEVQTDVFEPLIEKEVINLKDYYYPNETIEYKITVTNTASYEIHDVILKEEKENAIFKNSSNSNVEILSDKFIKILSIPSNSSVEVMAEYTILENDSKMVRNIVELKGAIADNNYRLKEKEYKATADIKIYPSVKICKKIDGKDVGNIFQFKISNDSYETWLILKKDECETLYLNPGSYYIKEIVPQEYYINKVEGSINSNNGILIVEENKDYLITFTNKFVRKGFLHSSGRVVNDILGGTL